MKSKRWTGLTYPSARALGSNGRRPPEGKNRRAFFSPPAWEITIAGVGLIGSGAGKRGEALLLPPRAPFLDNAVGSEIEKVRRGSPRRAAVCKSSAFAARRGGPNLSHALTARSTHAAVMMSYGMVASC